MKREASQRTYEAGGTLERRLVGRPLPDVLLQYAHEAFLSPVELARRRSLVIFFYPASEETTTPQNGSVVSADEQRAVAWMRCEGELGRLGYDVIGVSTQSSIQQALFASREPLPFILLSDPELKLAESLADDPDRENLGLPTDGPPTQRVYRALTLVVREQRIARVFYRLLRTTSKRDPAVPAATARPTANRISHRPSAKADPTDRDSVQHKTR